MVLPKELASGITVSLCDESGPGDVSPSLGGGGAKHSFNCATVVVCALTGLISLFLLCKQTHGPLSDGATISCNCQRISHPKCIRSGSVSMQKADWGVGGLLKDMTQICLYIRPCMMECCFGSK